MLASLTIPPEADLISDDNPVYIGNMNRGESRIVNWTLIFTASGVFSLDVNASGYRQDTNAYVEKHGYATVTVSVCGPYDIDVHTTYNMITSGLYPNLVILDVRTQTEYDGGHIYEAVWIPVSELEARIGQLAGHKNQEMIIVYCRSGVRSANASEILVSHNFTKVYNMLGGILAWQSAGYPVWIATVHNINTTFNYDTIQAAIDAPQTLDGHTILVDVGKYYEHVVVNKTVSLVGQNSSNTIIDGNGSGVVVWLTPGAKDATVSNFTIQNGESGVLLDSRNITLRNNNITANNRNFGNLASIEYAYVNLSYFIHDIDSSNTVNRKPIYYLVNKHDYQVPVNAGYVAVINSTNIILKNLNLTRNREGALFVCAGNCTLDETWVSNNDYGIRLDAYCSNNTVYHNNFVNNTNQAYVYESSPHNTWDDGYPSGGNCWSDYADADFLSGRYQNMTGSDGIGDKPYDIDEYNRDHYPLMKPYGGPHDIGIVNITSSNTLVTQGHNLSINVKVVNYGADTETFNVTAYANEIIVQTKTSTIPNRNSTTITLTWNTTEFAKGKYTISAKAHPVPGETDAGDNTLTDGLVKVILPDHDVGLADVMPYKTVVGKGCSVSLNVAAENWGNYTETFDITVCYSSENTTGIPIETQTVTLTGGGSTIVTFTWNTTGVANGNYTLNAIAGTVPGEIDTADNTLTDGWVIIARIGDITGPNGWPDGKCNIRDVAMVARLYGVEYPDPRYDPNCDLTGPTQGVADGKINIRDVALIARHYGETDP